MSSINSVRNFRILYFSKKNRGIKNLMRMRGKKCAGPAIYTYHLFLP